MTPVMHYCIVFRVYVLGMSHLYVVTVAALWMLRVRLRPYVRQIWMPTLHFHFGCKDGHMPEERERLPITLVRRAALHYGCVVLHELRYTHPHTQLAVRGISNALLLPGLI